MNVESFGIPGQKSESSNKDISVRNRQTKSKPINGSQSLQNNSQTAAFADSKTEDRCRAGACEITWKPIKV